MSRNHFVYKQIPSRPSFAADMSEDEQAIMGEHAAYWTGLFEEGSAVVFGVVMDQHGAWGLAVVEAHDEAGVRAMASEDPAVKANLCTYDIGVMPQAVVRPRPAAA